MSSYKCKYMWIYKLLISFRDKDIPFPTQLITLPASLLSYIPSYFILSQTSSESCQYSLLKLAHPGSLFLFLQPSCTKSVLPSISSCYSQRQIQWLLFSLHPPWSFCSIWHWEPSPPWNFHLHWVFMSLHALAQSPFTMSSPPPKSCKCWWSPELFPHLLFLLRTPYRSMHSANCCLNAYVPPT